MSAPSRDAPRKIVFVSYGAFDSNSAGHVFGFARGLAGMGHAVAVCGTGPIARAYSYGEPPFEFFAVSDFAAAPQAVIGFDGTFDPKRTVILCWTPREVVRRAVEPVVEQYAIPYLVHLEDDEEHLTKLWLGSSRLSVLRKKQVPESCTDLDRLAPFLAGAAGATVIVPKLTEGLPASLPVLELTPGVDLGALAEPLPALRRATIRRAVGVPADAPLIVYPGNAHRANVGEMRRLYGAIHMLRDRNVFLVRTGKDFSKAAFLRETGPSTGIIPLGYVDRRFLVDLLKCSDLFVQPGAPGPFSDYRLPSKLPEFMAIGRPTILPATNVGTHLRHGVDAMLLRSGAPEEIAGHVAAVLDDPGLAAQLSVNARAFAERYFRWDEQVGKLDAFIRQVA
jgi:glycosyltransferase involved in cell wall biosynthesis